MWKKFFIAGITLLGTFSIVYGYYYMNFQAATYSSGGNITGRIGPAGKRADGTYGSMEKGDLVSFSSTTSKGTLLNWRLIANGLDNSLNPAVKIPNSTNMYGYDLQAASVTTHGTHVWHAASGLLDSMAYMKSGEQYVRRTNLIKDEIALINQAVASNELENRLIHERLIFNVLVSVESAQLGGQNYIDYLEDRIFEFNGFYEMGKAMNTAYGNGGLNLSFSDFTIPSDECTGGAYWSGVIHGGGAPGEKILQNGHGVLCSTGELLSTKYPYSSPLPYRVATFLDLETVVFAASDYKHTAQGNSIYEVSLPVYNGSMANVVGEAMKMRILDPSKTIDFQDILNKNGDSIYTLQNISSSGTANVIENSTIRIKADANSSSSGNGVNTVSALIFDSSNQFIKYLPLGTANGVDEYEISIQQLGLVKGNTYAIQLVNENYTGTDPGPTECSEMSNAFKLTVVDSHKITYTKAPQSGASAGKDYEYNKNVNGGQKIGTITLNPTGVVPIHYEVISFDGSDTTYENFEISNLDQNGNSSLSNLDVKIKLNAEDLSDNSLKGGTYKFCIIATDANGDPESPNANTKVCSTLNVEKTSTSITFDNPNQTVKSISEANTQWSETATATPAAGTKITYSKVGGAISNIDIDKDSGQITYKGNDAFGKVRIKATVDDDPTTGNDNYDTSSAEKEVVIYRNVNGTVVPHHASSDSNTPIFTANQSNVKENGIIGTIQGSEGTPDPDNESKTTYTFGLKDVNDSSFFQVNTRGEIITKADLGVDTYEIVVTVSDRWSTKEIPVTIKVEMANAEELFFYETPTSDKKITTKSAGLTDTNVSVYATVKGSTNTNPVKYSILDGSTNIIEVNETSGAIMIRGVGTVTIVAEKQGISGQANARTELVFTVTAGKQNFIYVDESGNELPKTLDKYNAFEEIYGKDKTFQLHTSGNPPGSTVTYALKTGSPVDVIDVDADGTVSIFNASLNTQMGKVIIEATSHDPSGNYTDKIIELPINIKKADQTITFADKTYATSGTGTVTPLINAQDLSSNAGGVTINDTSYYITVDTSITSGIAWTNDGINIEYNYSGDDGLDIPLHVEKQGNRNYNKANADGQMRIMGPDESSLAVNVPGRIVYGDHFTIRSLQDDSSSVNVQYQFEVDNTMYISTPTINGNQATFDALKYSGNTMVKIKVTRTANGEIPLSKTISVKVLAKDINISIDDQTKLKGESNPVLSYQDFSNQLVSWNGVKDSILPGDVVVSTTANNTSSAGTYPIKGDARKLNSKYLNYNFTFTEGTLTIEEESIEDDWYHLELDDGTQTSYDGEWTNQDVNIVSDHYEYIELSTNQTAWNQNQVTVVNEGSYDQGFWMRKASGATTTEKQVKIKIDKKAPVIKSIKETTLKPKESITITTNDANGTLDVSGTKSIDYTITKQERTRNANVIQKTVDVSQESVSIKMENAGIYEVCATPTDNAGNIGQEKCETIEVKKIDVDVDDDGKPDFNDPDGDGCPDLNIKWQDDNGDWVVINGDRDYDGIPDLNIDGDGDGLPDLNIDTDKDGKPDINLVILKKTDWKPTKCVTVSSTVKEEYCTGTSVKPQINIDTNNNQIPDINIDINGNMKADINIDQNKNNQLDEFDFNLTSKINRWNPEKDYTTGKFQYDTETEYKAYINVIIEGTEFPSLNIDLDGDGLPDLNIDQDGDGIPETNIDGDGDGIADINLDPDGTGTAQENIIEITEWKPDTTIKGEHFHYLTMKTAQKNELEDNGVKVEKPDGTPFLPNFALKVEDVTSEYYDEIKEETKSEMKENQEVKKVFDVKLFKDDVEVQPDGVLKVKIPHEGIKNPILVRKNAQGSYESIKYTLEGSYLVYETEELGIVSILGDKERDTSVMGTYTPNIGGAITGDETNLNICVFLLLCSSLLLLLYWKKIQQ